MDDIMKSAFERAGYKLPKDEGQQSPPGKTLQQGTTQKPAEVQEDYTAQAEKVITELRRILGRNYINFTTSKIRNILGMVNEIYNDVVLKPEKNLDESIRSRIEYLKVRLIYECGREPKVIKPFVETAGLLDIISGIKDSKDKFIKFAHYMEALVAYHLYYGGKE